MSGIHQMLLSGVSMDLTSIRWINELEEITYGLGIYRGLVVKSGDIFVGETHPSSTDIKVSCTKLTAEGTISFSSSGHLAGSDDFQECYDIAVDSSGNIFLLVDYLNTGVTSLNLIKLNSSGTIQWTHKLTGSDYDAGKSLSIDSSDNVYIVSNSTSQGLTYGGLLVAKYNNSGTLQWQISVGGTSAATAVGAGDSCFDSGNNLIVCGSLAGRAYLIKFNSSGTIQWQRQLSRGTSSALLGIAVDSSDNVYCTGISFDASDYNVGGLVVKYNSSGTLQWQRYFNRNSDGPYSYGITVDPSNNVFICGSFTGTGSNFIIKYDSSGTIQWSRSLYKNLYTDLYVIRSDANNLYVLGYSSSKAIVAKLNITGDGTGTYSSYVYAALSITDATETLTGSTPTLTTATRTLTDSTISTSAVTLSITNTKISL